MEGLRGRRYLPEERIHAWTELEKNNVHALGKAFNNPELTNNPVLARRGW